MKKQLHKRIGTGAKKIGHKVTKYLLERDTFFATAWVFIFIVVLGSIPLNLGMMNPIKLGMKDFDFNDLYYSKVSGKIDSIDKRIVIINIGYANREELSMIVDKVGSFQPKVMGLDVLFDGPRDEHQDSLLRESFRRNKNLVLAVKYQTSKQDKLIGGGNFFADSSSLTGYVNFPYDSDYESIRYYLPFKADDHDKNLVLPSFTSALINEYDKKAYKKILKKVNQKTIINYSRELSERKKNYLVVELENLMTGTVDSSAIKGRIALLAYVNTNPNDVEDKKFTPMNERYYGKTVPDMNGIVVHANIISMILDKNYIKKVPSWVNLLLAVGICWLHMSFFIHYYLESHIWFHLAAKIAQVASAIFFVWLGMEIYRRYGLKVDMKLSLITIILAVDVIYFYEAWAVWMHKKFHYHTVFKPHHH
jgi:CHASE2 domain-containing sensor protein